MRKTITIIAAALLSASAFVQAAEPSCEAKAAERKLAGAAKTSFVQKCERESGQKADPVKACEAQAAEKKLAGAAKTSFVKKCERDAGVSQPDPAQVCEAQAAEKKLAGAAKTSFVTKCVKDAAAAK